MKDGWLQEELDEIVLELIAKHSPQWHMQRGLTITLPITKRQADYLYKALAKHFTAWTGKDIRHYKI